MNAAESLELPGPQQQEQTASVYGQVGEWSFFTLDGQKVEFSQFKGKVVFLNIWGTWCPPCRAEIPSIQRLYNSLKNKEIVFLLISDEKPETVRKYIKKKRYNLPVYIQSGDFPKVFDTQIYPSTYILDRGGRIVYKYFASAKWDDGSIRSMLLGLQ